MGPDGVANKTLLYEGALEPLRNTVIDILWCDALSRTIVHEAGDVDPEASGASGPIPQCLPCRRERCHVGMPLMNASGVAQGEQDIGLDVGNAALREPAVLGMQGLEQHPVEPGVRRKIGEVLVRQLAEATECGTQVATALRRQSFIRVDAQKDFRQGHLAGGGERVTITSIRHSALHNVEYTVTLVYK